MRERTDPQWSTVRRKIAADLLGQAVRDDAGEVMGRITETRCLPDRILVVIEITRPSLLTELQR